MRSAAGARNRLVVKVGMTAAASHTAPPNHTASRRDKVSALAAANAANGIAQAKPRLSATPAPTSTASHSARRQSIAAVSARRKVEVCCCMESLLFFSRG